jgi:hypothetical protein
VEKLKSIRELLHRDGKRLGALKSRAAERNMVLEQVRSALPPKLKEYVVSAGLEHGRLTIGVAGAAWASRLRYSTEAVRVQVAAALGIDIPSVRIKVVPPRG